MPQQTPSDGSKVLDDLTSGPRRLYNNVRSFLGGSDDDEDDKKKKQQQQQGSSADPGSVSAANKTFADDPSHRSPAAQAASTPAAKPQNGFMARAMRARAAAQGNPQPGSAQNGGMATQAVQAMRNRVAQKRKPQPASTPRTGGY